MFYLQYQFISYITFCLFSIELQDALENANSHNIMMRQSTAVNEARVSTLGMYMDSNYVCGLATRSL